MSPSAFDIAGLVLSLLSLLKDLKAEKTLQEKIEIIRESIRHQDDVIQLLEENKLIHDQFETLRIRLSDLNLRDIGREQTASEVDKKLADFLKYEQRHVLNKRVMVKLEVRENAETLLPIKKPINHLRDFFPELIQSLERYGVIIVMLKDLSERGNYGRDFQNCISQLSDCIDSVTLSADTVILSTVPVLAFMHYEIGKAVGDL